MTITEAKATIYANVVYACEKAGLAPQTTRLVQDACDTIIALADACETIVALADRKTDNSSEIPNNCEPQTENPCDGCVCDDGKHLIYCMNCKGIAWKTEPPKVETEPQTNEDQHVQRVEYVGNDEKSRCWTCKHFERMHETPIASDGNYYTYVVCTAKECHYEPQTEPQTERSSE